SSTLPPLKGGVDTGGFKVYADLHLAYDSLSQVLNRYLAGTRIETEKGPLKKKYIDVDAASVLASGGNRLTLKVKVSGSVNGTVYLTGKPVTDAQGWLTVQELDYDIATRNLLLGTAEWMLNKKITRKLNEMARFELNAYLQRFQQTMSQALNRDWGKGIRSTGRVNQFAVAEILPQPGYLFIRLLATGNMQLNLDELSF
ncbi:MAG: DUF4403 family protein, partial [Dinghuibacter sp.]|nr:DUF4403 family protein [Dinghuibacter sp.]